MSNPRYGGGRPRMQIPVLHGQAFRSAETLNDGHEARDDGANLAHPDDSLDTTYPLCATRV